LPKNGAVELLDVLFTETELDFEFGDPRFHAECLEWRVPRRRRPARITAMAVRRSCVQPKFFAAKAQFANELRKVSTNFGRALR
jgi:hypothetical protein